MSVTGQQALPEFIRRYGIRIRQERIAHLKQVAVTFNRSLCYKEADKAWAEVRSLMAEIIALGGQP